MIELVANLNASIPDLRRRIDEDKDQTISTRPLGSQPSQHQAAIRSCFHEGKFGEARQIYARGKASQVWPEWAFIAELEAAIADWARVHAEQDAARQTTLRQKVSALLDSCRFDEANSLYKAECSQWWRVSDYASLMDQARSARLWVQAYAGASLSGLDALYVESFSQLSGGDYAHLKLPKLHVRLARLAMPLDQEQLLACARPERHRLIRARAGSGKTRALTAHAALTIHDETLEPDQVLILAHLREIPNSYGSAIII